MDGLLSIAEFVSRMTLAADALEAGSEEMMDHAAKVIQDEAKAVIGHYQQGEGPYVGWAPLAASTQDERVREGFSPDDPLLRDGTLRDNIERSASPLEAAVGVPSKTVSPSYSKDAVDIGDIAIWQELGTQHIPPRSFLGLSAVRKGGEVAKIIWGSFETVMLTGRFSPYKQTFRQIL